MASALEGLTVLDLTRFGAGALSTMMLGDHGARVIRVIGLDDRSPRRGGFVVWDRGKECLRLDLEDCLDAGLGREADSNVPGEVSLGADSELGSLIAAADILVEDFAPRERPAFLQRACLDKINPRLVSCSITAYGLEGPYRDEPQIDDLVLARSGVLATLPGFRVPPLHVVHPLPSTGAALIAALGIAGALYDRERTGRGRQVMTSLLAGALLYHPKVVADHLVPNAIQTSPFGSAPFYSVYECEDGHWVQLGCVHPGFISRAADLMGIGDILKDPIYGRGHLPQTPEADDYLRKVLTGVMIKRPYDQWAEIFESNDIPFARARLAVEGLDDPQVRHNEMVVTLDDPEIGTIEQMGVQIKLSGTPGKVHGPRVLPPEGATEIPSGLGGVSARQNLAGDVPNAKSAKEDTNRLPLTGVRVLEITNLIAGPIAGRLLSDLGADVMKLEPPAGDISRPIGRTYFYSLNFGKRSICIDTSTPEGKAVVQAVAAKSDIVVSNLRPGATKRMGIGPELNENLIEAQVSGYGSTGPYSHRPGIDPLAQALMGLERAQGGQGNPPSFQAQLGPTDFTTGAAAAVGAVMALYARARGAAKAQQIEVNLLDGGILLSSEWFVRHNGQPKRPLADRQQYGLDPFHRLYPVADGHVYVVADEVGRAALAKALGLDDPGPVAQFSEGAVHPIETDVGQAFEAAFAKYDMVGMLALLRANNIPHAPATSGDASAFFDDPHTAANGLAVTSSHSTAGELTVAWRYAAFPGVKASVALPTPLLGEHTDDVLREAGYQAGEMAELHAQGVVWNVAELA